MWDMNKSYAILIATLVFLVGCATSKEPLVDGRQASPLLNESQALQIGIDYAKEKGWDVAHVWKDVTFRSATGEWQIFFDIRYQGGPYIVYVNDKTKRVRFEKGE